MICMAAVLLAVSAQIPVEPGEVLETRDLYNRTLESIDEGMWYRTEIVVNPGGLPYPALGSFREEFTLYWGCEGGVRWPVMVFYRAQFAAHSEYAEVLYTGEPGCTDVVFFYSRSGNLEGPTSEYRTWYDGDTVLYASQEYQDSGMSEPVVQYDFESGETDLLDRLDRLFGVL